ncbi:hypothetical protein GQ44DRAFT_723259 [Phaeosphaeriaceae sp. PMI808]|nr:hypothetical protein GQ44DRAFT_723259 [Phaeosphaeriaceae sp. PMI808]
MSSWHNSTRVSITRFSRTQLLEIDLDETRPRFRHCERTKNDTELIRDPKRVSPPSPALPQGSDNYHFAITTMDLYFKDIDMELFRLPFNIDPLNYGLSNNSQVPLSSSPLLGETFSRPQLAYRESTFQYTQNDRGALGTQIGSELRVVNPTPVDFNTKYTSKHNSLIFPSFTTHGEAEVYYEAPKELIRRAAIVYYCKAWVKEHLPESFIEMYRHFSALGTHVGDRFDQVYELWKDLMRRRYGGRNRTPSISKSISF